MAAIANGAYAPGAASGVYSGFSRYLPFPPRVTSRHSGYIPVYKREVSAAAAASGIATYSGS